MSFNNKFKFLYSKFFTIILCFCTFSLLTFSNQMTTTAKTITTYTNGIDESIPVDIKYKGDDLPDFLDYVFIKTKSASVRQAPSIRAYEVHRALFNEKFLLLSKLESEGRIWYKVRFSNGVGFLPDIAGDVRTFRFEKMVERINDVESFINENNKKKQVVASTNSYAPNPYNKDMDREKDKYGISIDQNIIGVYKPENLELHIPDRSILTVLKKGKTTSEVKVEGIPESPLVIENKYISNYPKVSKGFNKVIAADIANQNLGVFEKINGEWTLISYAYVKTGLESLLGFETPRGSFIVPTIKYEMGYRDLYGKDAGIARYAVRFSGGGYMHGTPLEHVEGFNNDLFIEQKEKGLGTYKGTRKCIRTTIEHGKFLFEWILGKNRNINYNDQHPSENVAFIIF